MAHSVSDHLHVMIADYDRFIRTVIPHYETMRAVQLELLARSLPSHGRVIDLGGGTGALAKAVAEKFPGVLWKSGIRIRRCSRSHENVAPRSAIGCISSNTPLPNRWLPA